MSCMLQRSLRSCLKISRKIFCINIGASVMFGDFPNSFFSAHLEESATSSPHIRLGTGFFLFDNLWSIIELGAAHLTAISITSFQSRTIFVAFGHAEVTQLNIVNGPSFRAPFNEDVRWLQVSMNDRVIS